MLPEMNQRSSAMTARMKTRLVVRSGMIGVGREEGERDSREREKRRGGGANRESVPVPVLERVSIWTLYGGIKRSIPIRTMLTIGQDITD